MNKLLLASLIAFSLTFSALADTLPAIRYTDTGANVGKTLMAWTLMSNEQWSELSLLQQQNDSKQNAIDTLTSAEIRDAIMGGSSTWTAFYAALPGIANDTTPDSVKVIASSPIGMCKDNLTGYNYAFATLAYFSEGIKPGAPYEIHVTTQLSRSASSEYGFDVSNSDFDSKVAVASGNLMVDAPEPVCGLFLMALAALGLRRK